jgi:hypothetical protein
VLREVLEDGQKEERGELSEVIEELIQGEFIEGVIQEKKKEVIEGVIQEERPIEEEVIERLIEEEVGELWEVA